MATADLCSDAFRFLLDELGYELTRADEGPRESVVAFESDQVRVSIVVDHPATATVNVSRIEGGASVETQGLFLVVRESAPGQETLLHDEAQTLEETLAINASLLRAHAMDLLMGDFSRGDRLKRTRAETLRSQRKEAFGTSTGETPRFDYRPMLDELFADADNDGIVDARCVQAHWDYDYALAEVGEYLGESVEDVQRRLDRWDGL